MVQRTLKSLRLAVFLFMASLFLFSCQSKHPGEGPVLFVALDYSYISIFQFPAEVLEELEEQQNYSEKMQLFVANESSQRSGQTPVLGTYRLVNSRLRFTPSYSLVAGQRYKVKFKVVGKWKEEFIEIPADDLNPSTSVSQVYPSSTVLPRNLLKFYIQFTDSMAQRFSYQNIALLTSEGDTISDAFLELEEELWSTDMKRFTLLFDPGRIKRGLGSQTDMGYTFQVGENYSLVVNSNWPDAAGRKLVSYFRKDFSIGPDDRNRPDPNDWSIHFPTSSQDSLFIDFKEPLDYGLINRVITIVDQNDDQLEGKISLNASEQQWSFKPNKTWISGNYQLKVELILEDLSGNNLKNVFDVDNRQDQTNLTGEVYHTIPFRVD